MNQTHKNTLEHGMLLDSKYVMDNAMPELQKLRQLIPTCLHADFQKMIDSFEDDLCACDVADRYVEKT